MGIPVEIGVTIIFLINLFVYIYTYINIPTYIIYTVFFSMKLYKQTVVCEGITFPRQFTKKNENENLL